MKTTRYDPDLLIELLRMPYHVAQAFRALCKASEAETPADKMVLMGAAQEHVDQELIRLRVALQSPPKEVERLFGAVLDPDFGLAEEALNEAYQMRESLAARKEGSGK